MCNILCGGVILLFFALAPAAQAESRPLRIGVVLGFSGPGSFWSEYQRMGLELAAEELTNAGQALQIIWEDSKTTPVGAVSAFRKLSQADKVHAVIGDIFAFVTEPLLPLAVQYKVPVVTPALTQAICERGQGYSFTVASQIPQSVGAFETLLTNLQVKKAALVTFDDDSWGGVYRKMWLKLLDKMQITLSDDVVLPEMTPDFKPIFLRVSSRAPDAILFAHEPLSARKALLSTPFKGHFISANSVLEVLANNAADHSLVEGVYLVDPLMQAGFSEAFQRKFKKEPILEAHAGYEALRAIAAAHLDASRPLAESLRSVKIDGVAGKLDLSQPCRGRYGTWVPKQIRNGQVVSDL